MDTRTGDLYPSKEEAIEASVPEADIVKVDGPTKAVRRLQAAIRKSKRPTEQMIERRHQAQAHFRRKQAKRGNRFKAQKASRRANRNR